MICTAEDKSFVLKSGELTFHKPNEFHNLTGNGRSAPNVSVITFVCHSREMRYFEGRIFKLSSEERAMFSMLIGEGRLCYRPTDEHDPLRQGVKKLDTAPVGSSQMTKNLLEAFLILLRRNTDMMAKGGRETISAATADIPQAEREILELISNSLYSRLTVRDIAEALGKSESCIKKTFAAYRSGGIIKYLNSEKIREARKLIREGKYNLSEISDLLGFDTPQYFSRVFKSFTKMTPTEYRNSIVKEHF